jgi:hypothetical protein
MVCHHAARARQRDPHEERSSMKTLRLFKAQPRKKDGKTEFRDFLLEALVALAFGLRSDAKRIRVTLKCDCPAVHTVWNAACFKFSKLDTHKKPYEARSLARKLIVYLLTEKKDWRDCGGIFAAYAESNDREFFELIGRGESRQTDRVFERIDWLLMVNWEQWIEPPFPKAESIEPLKYWHPRAILHLLQERDVIESAMTENAIRSRCDNLRLKSVKPYRVVDFLPKGGAVFGIHRPD